jgi:hypothetical protein
MSTSPQTAMIRITAYDGTGSPLNSNENMLINIVNDTSTYKYQSSYPSTQVELSVPFHDGPGDVYGVSAFVKGYETSGFPTVKVSPTLTHPVDIMLLPKGGRFRFSSPDFDSLTRGYAGIANLFGAGQSSSQADDRYQALLDSNAPPLACFFNITTAMTQIQLPSGTVLDYMKQVIWDDPTAAFAQDRFFGYADKSLIDQVILATHQGVFAPDPNPAVFHPGASRSWKQIQFGEANVQLTFHESDPAPAGMVKIEPDIDYFKDLPAHGIFEVIPNALSKTFAIGPGLTDPKEVYVLRWIAGRYANFPPFIPPYEIV